MRVHRLSSPSLSFSFYLPRFSSFFRDELPSSLSRRFYPTAGIGHTYTYAYNILFLSSRRFIPSRKPDHAPWILFASSLVLRSYSWSKLRLPTALEVSRKSGRELYLSLAQHRERESKEEHVSRFPAGARYSDCLTLRYRSETKRTRTDIGISLHLSLYLMIYLPIARVARCDKLSTIRRNTALKL